MRYPYAQFLAFICAARGWWRSFKSMRRLIVSGQLRSGDHINLTLKLNILFPEYDADIKEEVKVNGESTETEQAEG